MAKRKKRIRTVQREADRDTEKLKRDVERLYALERGGASDRPIVIASPSQVEVDAESLPCPFCRASMRAENHEVVEALGERLRRVVLVCSTCKARWPRYYRLGATLH